MIYRGPVSYRETRSMAGVSLQEDRVECRDAGHFLFLFMAGCTPEMSSMVYRLREASAHEYSNCASALSYGMELS